MARDDIPVRAKEALARRVNYLCSNPGCGKPTAGPHSDPSKALNIGVAAHITAASRWVRQADGSWVSEQVAGIAVGAWHGCA